jgi:hypothetical protein
MKGRKRSRHPSPSNHGISRWNCCCPICLVLAQALEVNQYIARIINQPVNTSVIVSLRSPRPTSVPGNVSRTPSPGWPRYHLFCIGRSGGIFAVASVQRQGDNPRYFHFSKITRLSQFTPRARHASQVHEKPGD